MIKQIVTATIALAIVSCQGAPSHSSDLAASGSSWCHNKKPAVAPSGEELKLDWLYLHRNTHGNNLTYMSPLWLNLTGNFSGRESVRVVMVPFGYSNKMTTPRELSNRVTSLDLSWNESQKKFTGSPLNELITYYHEDGDDMAFMTSYDFAVVVDGRWLKLGGKEKTNFYLDPSQPYYEARCDYDVE